MATDIAAGEFDWLTDTAVRGWLGSLEEVLESSLECTDTLLGELANHLVQRGGKRIRPALLFLAASATSPPDSSVEEEPLLRAAAAVELLHVAALYHDDVMDRAERRRGARTVNAVRGDAAAVTAGTFVFSRAVRELAVLDGEIAAWAGEAALALTLGQLQEAENTFNLDHRLDSYTQIVARKTAVLFELPCRVGARLAGARQDVVDELGLYGRALGLAFQAADDTLDMVAAPPELGKMPGIDLREGVYGLPVLLALHHHTPGHRRLKQILGAEELSESDHREAHRLVVDAGGVVGAMNIARQYAGQAADHLAGVADGEAKASLARLADFVVLRGY